MLYSQAFQNSTYRSTIKRGNRVIEDEASTAFFQIFASKVEKAVPMNKFANPTSDWYKVLAYAVTADRTSFSMEACNMRTARLTFHGYREVVCAPAWEVSMFLAESAVDKRMPSLKDLRWNL